MNINTKFLNEAMMLEHKWNKLGLMDGIKEKFSRSHMAVLLEGQRLINEQPNTNIRMNNYWLNRIRAKEKAKGCVCRSKVVTKSTN